MILDLLTANPAGLTLQQLRESAGADVASLSGLVGDGRVEPCDLGGVDGYRLAQAKAAQPERKRRTGLSLADTDALRKALGLPEEADGAAMIERATELSHRTYVEPTEGTSPGVALPDGWAMHYMCGKARVYGRDGGWCWTVDSESTEGSGGLSSDLSLALARADAVRVLS
jgi:hypothetical protein